MIPKLVRDLNPLLKHMLNYILYRYHHLRDLHSFPTRRSSDLTSPAAHASCACTQRSDGGSTTSPSTTSADRKSTRLNSSHVAISYAVFCLEKKIKCEGIVEIIEEKQEELVEDK